MGFNTGGPGWKAQTRDETALAFLRRRADQTLLASVCTCYPGIDVQNAMLVDNGSIITGGVTLCIDATLYILETCLGSEVAAETARIREYSRARKADSEQFPLIINDSAHDGRDRVKQRRRADSH